LSAHALPFDRDWLKNIIEPFGNENVAGVMGKSLPHPDCNPFDRRGLYRRFGTDRKYLDYNSSITFSNANSAIRKKAWQDVSFDEALPYSEDLKWSRGMMQKGWVFIYEPTATVFHSHNETPRQLFHRFYNESKARSLMGFSEGRFSKRHIAFDFIVGTFYDLFTSVGKYKSFYWAMFSLRRRFWINLGRYFGSRSMARERVDKPLRSIGARIGLTLFGYLDGMLQRLTPLLVGMTNRESGKGRPLELFYDEQEKFWFKPFIRKGSNVMTIGVGKGKRILKAAEFANRVYGIDKNSEALYVANFLSRWEEKRNISLLEAHISCLPFKKDSIDCLINFNKLKNVNSLELFIENGTGILGPGGLFLITIRNSQTPWKNTQFELGLKSSSGFNPGALFKKDEVVALCQKYGLVLRETIPARIDSPFSSFVDFLGGISISLYKKIIMGSREKAFKEPWKSSEFHLVFSYAGKL